MRDIHRLLVQLNLLSLAGQFFVVSGKVSCSDVPEGWCEITPAYDTLNINPGHSETIICTIPSTPGAFSTVHFVNQFGDLVTDLQNVDLYLINESSSHTQSSYHVNISWTLDKDTREQLKVLQCVANFECRTRPYKTSVISINFLDYEQGLTTEDTTPATIQMTSTTKTASTTQMTSTTQTASTTKTASTTQMMSTTQMTSTTTTGSGCVCTPSQCAAMIPDIDRNNEFLQTNLTNQGFKLSCTLNSLLFSAIMFIMLCSIC